MKRLLALLLTALAFGAQAQTLVQPRNGGTGLTSYTANDILFASAATTLGKGTGLTFSSSALSAVLVTSNAVGTKQLITKNFASQTANNFEAQTSGGTAYVTIGPDVLSGAAATSNFLNVTGTLPTTVSAAQAIGVNFSITGAGSSSFAQRATTFSLLIGYTGSSTTVGSFISNASAGTGTGGFVATANYGATTNSLGVGAGHNVGNGMTASGSTSLNMGGIGRAITTASTLSVGLAGLAAAGTTTVGVFAGLMSTAPTLASSAALIADNGAVAANIVDFRDNGTSVFTIADGGAVTATQAVATGALAVTGTITASAIASSGAAQSGYLCYNTTGGIITYDGGATCLISREEYKDEIGPIEGALDTVMALRPYWGAYKSDSPMADKTVQAFLGARKTGSVDMRLVSVDKHGEPLGVRDNIGLLVRAIQEQQVQINQLKGAQ